MREIDRHDCEDDDGKEYVVIEYQHYRMWRPLNGPPQETPTVREFLLVDGRDVNQVDDNTFQIVLTDKIIRKV